MTRAEIVILAGYITEWRAHAVDSSQQPLVIGGYPLVKTMCEALADIRTRGHTDELDPCPECRQAVRERTEQDTRWETQMYQLFPLYPWAFTAPNSPQGPSTPDAGNTSGRTVLTGHIDMST